MTSTKEETAPPKDVYPSPPPSPGPEDSQTEERSPILDQDPTPTAANNEEIEALKTLLKIDTDRCQCPKATGDGFCNKRKAANGSAEEANANINRLLAQLVNKSCSAAELEQILEDLAKQIHCSSHSTYKFIESRIDAWVQDIFNGKDGMSHQLTKKRELRRIIGQIPDHCTGYTKTTAQNGDPKTCRQTLSGEKKLDCLDAIDCIILCTEWPSPTILLNGYLVKLAQNLLCHYHDKHISRQQTEWQKLLQTFGSRCELAMRQVLVQNGIQAGDKANPDTLLTRPPPARRDVFKTSKFEIRGKGEGLAPGKTWQEGVKDRVGKALKKSSCGDETKSGYLYAYKVQGNDEFVKIGYTTRSTTVRHGEWEEACYRRPESVYEGALVPNALRLERLIHAELVNEKVRIYCEACQKQHLEWFEISNEKAIGVIRKWELWMRGNPYENIGTETRPNWTLKSEEMRRLADVEDFLDDLDIASM
ncbi:hypothetical protein VHEMI04692 [[Torrubiella] hemipterigena]|uniref:Bacteriophage T5 Orf172 DNA-binding domain-containing protein n=1 Tax=[Torrubiella] hemipterigena TaxID=1531966 RepID=A0A0A1TGW7_9HYPO|nr:hypothetical protein VHEMI04692 [[Torrubiella] hemipterigena]